MNWRTRCILGALIATVALLSFRDSATKRRRASQRDNAISRLTVKQLVEGLASKNTSPVDTSHGGRRGLFLPANYDVAHQQHVRDCFDELMKRGKDSFPELIAHLDDKRYSCLYESHMIPVYIPRSVGFMCETALALQVRPCPTYLHIGGRRLGHDMPVEVPTAKEAAAWFEHRKRWSLLEMQRDAWRMTEDFIHSDEYANRVSPRQRPTADFLREQLAPIEWCLKYLAHARKPIRSRPHWSIKNGEPMITAGATMEIDPAIEDIIGMLPFNATTDTIPVKDE